VTWSDGPDAVQSAVSAYRALIQPASTGLRIATRCGILALPVNRQSRNPRRV